MYLIPAVIVFVELLKKITGSLEEKGISYMVSGSLALNVYSVPRMTYDIDLVISAHTHKLFEKPRVYTNLKGNDTIVNQVGWAGMYLGRLDYVFSSKKMKKLLQSHKVEVLGKITE